MAGFEVTHVQLPIAGTRVIAESLSMLTAKSSVVNGILATLAIGLVMASAPVMACRFRFAFQRLNQHPQIALALNAAALAMTRPYRAMVVRLRTDRRTKHIGQVKKTG